MQPSKQNQDGLEVVSQTHRPRLTDVEGPLIAELVGIRKAPESEEQAPGASTL